VEKSIRWKRGAQNVERRFSLAGLDAVLLDFAFSQLPKMREANILWRLLPKLRKSTPSRMQEVPHATTNRPKLATRS
jgi:hypothetical protein